MYKKSTLLIVLIIGLASISALSYFAQPVKAAYNVVEIDINPNGSITPADAPVTNVDNTFYTLTDDVNITGITQPYNSAAIRILRGNTIFNGNGHILTGYGNNCFVVPDGVNNVTIENSTAKGFDIGLYLASDYNTIRWNTFYGSRINSVVRLQGAGNSILEGNIITNGGSGVEIAYGGPNNCTFTGNSIGNSSDWAIAIHVAAGACHFYHNIISGPVISVDGPDSTWDNGYPSGGNYWSSSNYRSPDLFSGPYQNITGGDGIGDNPYQVSGGTNIDHYPFMMINICNVSQTPPKANVLSTDTVKVNATVTHYFPLAQVILNCTFTNSSATWTDSINMTNLEDDIWNGTIPSMPAGTNVTYVIIAQDNMGNSINSTSQGYTFDYPVAIPEFPTTELLPILFVVTLFVALVQRRKRSYDNGSRENSPLRVQTSALNLARN